MDVVQTQEQKHSLVGVMQHCMSYTLRLASLKCKCGRKKESE